MKILSVANQKGGVGKSTLSVHLAYASLEKGLRVLLVDMDKQASLSLSFPAAKDSTKGVVASQLYDPSVKDGKPEYISEKLAIIRSDNALLAIDAAVNEVIKIPAVSLRKFANDFDVCIVDTPPLLGIRLMASLTASDFVLTPVSIGLYELAGVADLMQTIHVVRTQGYNPRLRHVGILPMKTNSRSKSQREGLDMLRQRYGNAILPDSLSELAPVREAIELRKAVWTGTKGAGHLKAAKEWRSACDSILKRIM